MQQKINKLPTTPMAFFWHFLKKQPVAFTVFFLAPLLIILEAVVMPYALKMVIDAFAEYDQKRHMIMQAIIPALILGGTAWFALIILVRLQEWWQVYALPRFEADIRMSAVNYLLDHSYNYFAGNLSGDLANKISDLPRALDSLGMHLRWQVVATIGVVTASLIMMYIIQPAFAIITLIWVIIHVILSFAFIKYINSASEIHAENKSILSGRIVDTITNIISSKIFAAKKHEINYINKAQQQEKNSNAKLKWRIMIYRLLVDIPTTIMWIFMGYFLITYWQKNLISTGDLTFIFTSIWAVMFRLWFLGESLAEMFKEYGIISQALSIITKPYTLTDSKNAKILKAIKGRIKFNNVTFHYNEGKNIFENKNITIEAGEKVGLVGFSGSGKSTFVNLILRFFDVESGSITIDDQDVRDVTQDSLRNNISMIPQDTTLFHRTLMENIRYSKTSASDKEVIKAAQKAHCHEFIMQMPEGYDSLVGERGVKLSGGQRQRIAVARAILKNAPILILDEATSALDSVTEKHIQTSLLELMQKRTTIVIAHRLSTLSAMDRILVFDKGHIIEDSSHKTLLKKNGHYARMWRMQAGGFLPDTEKES